MVLKASLKTIGLSRAKAAKVLLIRIERYLSENALIRNTAPTEAEPDARKEPVTFSAAEPQRSQLLRTDYVRRAEREVYFHFIRLRNRKYSTINFVFKSGEKL